MRERHPIDDLFRRVLSDAEATPPPSVWRGVVRERHWGHRLLLQLERRWGLAIFLLLILAGAPAAWWSIRDNAVREMATAEIPVPLATTAFEDAVRGGSRSAPGEVVDRSPATSSSDPAVTAADHSPAPRDPREQGSRVNTGTPDNGHEPLDRAISGLPVKEMTGHVTAGTGPTYHMPNAAGAVALTQPSMRGSGYSVLQDEQRADPVDLEPAPLRQTHFDRPVVVTGELHSTPGPAAYVLPKGHYWIGVQVGYANISGFYEGPSALGDALNNEEDWLDQSTAGLVVGRRWRNGFSMGVGAELMKRRSRFLHNEKQPGPTTITVDTTWSNVPSGPTDVYIWEIDSILSMEPGIERTYSATNTYTILRIPLELGYRREVRRWIFGVRSGLTLTLPLSQTGQTLVEDGDGGMRTAGFDNTDTGKRFSMGMEGFVGVNAGYMLNERWTAHLGPVLVGDLGGGGEPALRTTQFGGQLRIEYELPERERTVVPVGP